MSNKIRISITIDDDIHEKIKEYLEIAKIENKNESLSNLINEFLKKYVK